MKPGAHGGERIGAVEHRNLAGRGSRNAFAATGANDAHGDAQAQLLLRAMIQAARADGRIDAGEERAILERTGSLDADERACLQRLLREPVDAEGLACSVPRGMEREVYAVALLAMDVDERAEARFLRQLARGVGLSADQRNAIHRDIHEPELFRRRHRPTRREPAGRPHHGGRRPHASQWVVSEVGRRPVGPKRPRG